MGPTPDHRQPEGRVHAVRPRHLPGHQEPGQQDPRAGRPAAAEPLPRDRGQAPGHQRRLRQGVLGLDHQRADAEADRPASASASTARRCSTPTPRRSEPAVGHARLGAGGALGGRLADAPRPSRWPSAYRPAPRSGCCASADSERRPRSVNTGMALPTVVVGLRRGARAVSQRPAGIAEPHLHGARHDHRPGADRRAADHRHHDGRDPGAARRAARPAARAGRQPPPARRAPVAGGAPAAARRRHGRLRPRRSPRSARRPWSAATSTARRRS